MSDNSYLDQLFSQINPNRLKQFTLELARIASPTGDTEQATQCFADYFSDLGFEVVFSNPLPHAPNVAAYHSFGQPGPTLQFDGHMDVIAHEVDGQVLPVPHSVEPYEQDGILYGRGVADMKGGLAVIAEAARILAASGLPLRGKLLCTTHGWHEAPVGSGEGVRALIAEGHVGDAVLVAEGASDSIPVMGRGMAIYQCHLSREGQVTHENSTVVGTPHPLFAIAALADGIEQLQAQLTQDVHPQLGCETIFLGQIHGGDFYNRFPTEAMLQGTRRYFPENSFADVQQQFEKLTEVVANERGVQLTTEWQLVRESYAFDADTPIVHSLRKAYQEVKGIDPEVGAYASVGDAGTFAREAGVPAIWCGPGGHGAHSDLESLHIGDQVERVKIYLATAVGYLAS